ncbi:hypothetical protein ACS0TY_022637 [Phlomoides rotata]
MSPLKGEKTRNDYDSKTRNLNVDPSNDETQQIDSQFSPGDYIEDSEDDDFLYPGDTMPVDDSYLLEDEFETQLANLAGETQMVDLDEETQVMDFAGETQVVDLAGETQVLDDLDCMKSMDIEFFDEFNDEVCADSEDEEINNADINCETQDLSHDDPVKNDDTDSVGLRSSADKDSSKEGSFCRGFTAIRAASVRASGLAASARRTSVSLCTRNDNASIEKETHEQDGSSVAAHSLKSGRKTNLDNTEKLRNSNICKVGSRAVRQLFKDDENAEVSDSETDINRAKDNLDVPEQLASEDCLAGLSYANSQEPGELSQAHALEVVDKFLDLNFMDCDKITGRRVSKLEKPKVVSGAKGSRDLAKSSTLKSTVEDCGIYDWDDMREDDGGGEFFMKKKELFFPKGGPKQRCRTEPRKSKIPGLENVKTVGDCVGKDERKITKNKIGDPVYSDSGVMHKSRSNGKSLLCGEKVPQKNLIKNFLMVSGHKVVDEDLDKDVPDMRSIGPDTQMAAEAMENLCFEEHLANSNNNGPNNGVHSITKAAKGKKLRNGTAHSEENLASSVPYVGVLTRHKRTKRISTSNELSPIQSKKIRKKRDRVLEETEERRLANVNVSMDHRPEATGRRSVEKHELKDQLYFCVPVAHRTRISSVKRSKVSANSLDARDEINNITNARGFGETTAAIDKTVITEKARKVRSTGFKQSNISRVDTSGASNIDAVDDLQGRRSRRSERLNKSSEVASSIRINPDRDLLNNSSACNDHALPCLDPQSKKKISHQTVKTRSSKNDAAGASTSKQGHEKSDDETLLDGAERTGRQEASPRRRTSSTCATPANCTTPKATVSPICMGDEYHKQSSRSSSLRLSLLKEIADLTPVSPVPYGGTRESRKRKDITSVRVLFSQHLDVDVVKKQKKILARLGGAVASSMLDATHFVADEFVRTRNMLEAIAFGKPVVTHLWIESCEQASCLIDEKNYVLRDAKKEKEFGFSLPVSLARAMQHPLLQGQKVLVTPNTKPGKDILANLVKAVQGLVVERLGRSVLKNKKLPDDLLILSCEEDHETCIPFLEKGGAIYSSELLLNGIVTQKLEYERHRLFVDDVKRTRSTIWVKKNNKFLPVTK